MTAPTGTFPTPSLLTTVRPVETPQKYYQISFLWVWRWEVRPSSKAASLDVKAFVREHQQESRAPMVGELPQSLPLLWSTEVPKKFQGSATALSPSVPVNATRRCPCPAPPHESCGETALLFRGLCCWGLWVSYLPLCAYFCLFLSYLTEVVWRLTNICSVFVNPPVKGTIWPH